MFCNKCGAQIKDGDAFCKKCGAKVVSDKINSEASKKLNEATQSIKNAVDTQVPKLTAKIKKINKKVLIVIACAVVAAIIAIVVIANAASYITIDISKLYTVSFDGLNQEGTATIELNEEEVTHIASQIVQRDSDAETELYQIRTAPKIIYDYMGAEVTPKENLSNGDTVTVTVRYDEEYYKSIKLKVINAEQTLTVEGLVEPQEIDVFEGLKLEFSGMSPFIACNIVTGECSDFAKQFVRFQADKEYYANGDSVIITANYSPMDATAEQVRVMQTEKQYTVDGNHAEYLASLDGVDLTPLQNAMRDQLHLKQKASGGTSYFVGTSIGGTYSELVSEEEKGNTFIVLREKEMFANSNDVPYNQYIIYTQCNIKTEVAWFMTSVPDKYTVDVLIIANNLYIDENGALKWDAEMQSKALLSSDAGDLSSNYIAKQQDKYNIVSSTDGAGNIIGNTESPQTNVATIFDAELKQLILEGKDRYYSKDELMGKSQTELTMLRNGMFALSGKEFVKNMDVKAFFEGCDWYTPISSDDAVIESKINDFQKKNADLIVEVEKELGYR